MLIKGLKKSGIFFFILTNLSIFHIPPISLKSNPFKTGQCLATEWQKLVTQELARLNPFGTGQCLPTSELTDEEVFKFCLNPFGTGQCLPTS